MSIYLKDPEAVLDFSIDWSADYLQEGEEITTSSWSVFPDDEGGLQVMQAPDPADGIAVVYLSGGAPGVIYRVTNQFSTSRGRTDERSLTIRVEHQ